MAAKKEMLEQEEFYPVAFEDMSCSSDVNAALGTPDFDSDFFFLKKKRRYIA